MELTKDKAELEQRIQRQEAAIILAEAQYKAKGDEIGAAKVYLARLQGALAYINDNIEARSKDGSTDKPKDSEGSGGGTQDA